MKIRCAVPLILHFGNLGMIFTDVRNRLTLHEPLYKYGFIFSSENLNYEFFSIILPVTFTY